MTLQIAKIILYSHKGQMRELSFRTGALNIVTGASKTGKSALIDIVDYCTGRSECYVAEGAIRRHVLWFSVLFQFGETQIFIARRNPGVGERTSSDIILERGREIIPPLLGDLHKNTTVDAVEKFLASAIGISENEHRPPEGQTRAPLEANFRHALVFSLQDQDEIDSKKVLFHRQGDNFVAQAIKDTLPYFLGAIDEDRLLMQAQIDAARRQLRQLERQLREADELDANSFPRARGLFEEAKQVGLIDECLTAASYDATIAALRDAIREDVVREELLVGDGLDVLAALRLERQDLRAELEKINSEIRSTRLFNSESTCYEREVKEQRARLSAVGLFKAGDHDDDHCPLCESRLDVSIPSVRQVARSLREISEQLEAVESENPRLQARLAALQREEEQLDQRLRENQSLITARIRENEILRVQQDSFIVQARTIGKIIQYIDTISLTQNGSALLQQVESARSRVRVLEQELDTETVRQRVETYLNIIGRYMTDYSADLNLEHKGSQLRLDIKNLTVVADTLEGPIPLQRMGSGENWVGYHVLAHLALHRWFRKKGRPVPAFLMLDQPSQAHYPPDLDADDGALTGLKDEDKAAVQQLFALVARVAAELAPELQIIVMDHADIEEVWFKDAVVARWRYGDKLIPDSWLNE